MDFASRLDDIVWLTGSGCLNLSPAVIRPCSVNLFIQPLTSRDNFCIFLKIRKVVTA